VKRPDILYLNADSYCHQAHFQFLIIKSISIATVFGFTFKIMLAQSVIIYAQDYFVIQNQSATNRIGKFCGCFIAYFYLITALFHGHISDLKNVRPDPGITKQCYLIIAFKRII